MKIVVIILLLAIVASLGTGLYHLSREEHDSPRMLKALKVRVALSLLLIVFLVASYYLG
ncbi:MAG: twin transmembrane helix small protein [Proteobacteria bacterium]|nr:twin transmembrane helix small protein [Pseudomonadota bacterium]